MYGLKSVSSGHINLGSDKQYIIIISRAAFDTYLKKNDLGYLPEKNLLTERCI